MRSTVLRSPRLFDLEPNRAPNRAPPRRAPPNRAPPNRAPRRERKRSFDDIDYEDRSSTAMVKQNNSCSLEDKRLVDSIMDDIKLDYVESDENLKDFYNDIFGEANRESTVIQKLMNSKTKIDFSNIAMADRILMIEYTSLQANLAKYMYTIANPFTAWLGKIKRLDNVFTFKKSQALEPWMLDTECIKECEYMETMYYEKNMELINAISKNGVSKREIDELLKETITLGQAYIGCRVQCKENIDKEGVIASAVKTVQSILKFKNHSLTTSFWLVSTFTYYYTFQAYYATYYLANLAQGHRNILRYVGNNGWITGILNKGRELSDTQLNSAVYSFITESFGIESNVFALYYQTVGSYDGVAGTQLTESQIDFMENNVRGIVEVGRMPLQQVEQVGSGVLAQASYYLRSALGRVEHGAGVMTGGQDRVILKGFMTKYLDIQEYFTVGFKVKALFTASTLFAGYLNSKNVYALVGCMNGSMFSKLQVMMGVAGRVGSAAALDANSLISFLTSSALVYFMSLFVFYIGKAIIDNPNITGYKAIKSGAYETAWKAIPSVNNFVNISQDLVQTTYTGGRRVASNVSRRLKRPGYCETSYSGNKLKVCKHCVDNFKLKDPDSIDRCIQRVLETTSYRNISYKDAIKSCRDRGFKGTQLSYCIRKLRDTNNETNRTVQVYVPDYLRGDYDPEEEFEEEFEEEYGFDFGKNKIKGNTKMVKHRNVRKPRKRSVKKRSVKKRSVKRRSVKRRSVKRRSVRKSRKRSIKRRRSFGNAWDSFKGFFMSLDAHKAGAKATIQKTFEDNKCNGWNATEAITSVDAATSKGQVKKAMEAFVTKCNNPVQQVQLVQQPVV